MPVRCFVFGMVCTLVFGTAVRGHDLGVTATPVSGKLAIEVYFADDERPEGARVVIVDDNDHIVAEGLTDTAGVWITAMPGPGVYRITADAGDGHRKTITMNVEPEAVTSDGTDRAAFLRTPWGRVILGCGLIGLLVLAVRMFRRVKPTPPPVG